MGRHSVRSDGRGLEAMRPPTGKSHIGCHKTQEFDQPLFPSLLARGAKFKFFQDLAVNVYSLHRCGLPVYTDRYKIFDTGHLLSNRRIRLVDIVKRRAAAAAHYIVNAILKIVLIVVIVPEQTSGDALLL